MPLNANLPSALTNPPVGQVPVAAGPRAEPPYEYTEVLLACMQSRCELLEALKTLADSQASLAGQADVDITLGLLARKQALLDELASVHKKMGPYFNDDPNARVWQHPSRREQCRRLADQGKLLLQQTMNLEKSTLEELSLRRDAVAARLQDGKDSTLARTAYMSDDLLSVSALDIGDL